MDLHGSVKVRGEFSLLCVVHNVKKIVKRVLEGTVSLPGKYDQLIEEAVPGYGEEQLTLVGASTNNTPASQVIRRFSEEISKYSYALTRFIKSSTVRATTYSAGFSPTAKD